jgi:hypothetical protein
MSNEINISASLFVSKNRASLSAPPAQASLTMAGSNLLYQTQSVPTAGAALNLGLLTGTPKKLLLTNLDPTNNITIYGDAGFTQVHDILTPGDFVLRSPGAALYVKATTAACLLEVRGCEA